MLGACGASAFYVGTSMPVCWRTTKTASEKRESRDNQKPDNQLDFRGDF